MILMLVRYSPDAKGRSVKKALIYTKTEHAIQKSLIDADAIRIISHLRANGFEGYLVGGAVRDLLIGKTPKDFDIVTNAEPAKIKRIFRNSRIIGKRFRLVHIFFGSTIFEVSTFRSLVEGTTGNSFGTMDDDVQRRDFTMNALFYDPLKEQVIDYVGGVKDIQKRTLKPVIPLKIIFSEDPVRMIRAIKYSVSTECQMPFLLRRSIRKNSHLLEKISPSRLTEEIIKILKSGKSEKIIQQAINYDLFMYLQPAACSLIDENKRFAQMYAQGFIELDTSIAGVEEIRLGRMLIALIKPLITLITDWEGFPPEVYSFVYYECRRFILPMNPPRTELEYAVKYCLREGGLAIKVPRVREFQQDNLQHDLNRESLGVQGIYQKPVSNPSRKRSRRRKRPTTSSTLD